MEFLPAMKPGLSSCPLRLKFEGLFFAKTLEALHRNKTKTLIFCHNAAWIVAFQGSAKMIKYTK